MKKIIQFEEKEFKEKFHQFVQNFIDQSDKGYGVKLFSNEENRTISCKKEIAGSLLMAWTETFKEEN